MEKKHTLLARSTICYKHCRCKYYWSKPASAAKFRITSWSVQFNFAWCIDIVVRYTNQKYKQCCREHPRGSVARRFRGYKPFLKEKVLAFISLSFISGAHKATKNRILLFPKQAKVVTFALVYSLWRIIWLWFLGIQNNQNLYFIVISAS